MTKNGKIDVIVSARAPLEPSSLQNSREGARSLHG